MPKKTKAEIRKSISKSLSKDPEIRARQVKRRKSLVKKKRKALDIFDVAGLGREGRLRGSK